MSNNRFVDEGEQELKCTYLVHLSLLCTDESAELLALETEQAETTIEDLIGQLLLSQFDSVIMDEVQIQLPRPMTQQLAPYAIRINARCPHHAFPSSAGEAAMIGYMLEALAGYILTELFSMVAIEQVEVKFMPTQDWVCSPALSCQIPTALEG